MTLSEKMCNCICSEQRIKEIKQSIEKILENKFRMENGEGASILVVDVEDIKKELGKGLI